MDLKKIIFSELEKTEGVKVCYAWDVMHNDETRKVIFPEGKPINMYQDSYIVVASINPLPNVRELNRFMMDLLPGMAGLKQVRRFVPEESDDSLIAQWGMRQYAYQIGDMHQVVYFDKSRLGTDPISELPGQILEPAKLSHSVPVYQMVTVRPYPSIEGANEQKDLIGRII